jgi:hypothetical protein
MSRTSWRCSRGAVGRFYGRERVRATTRLATSLCCRPTLDRRRERALRQIVASEVRAARQVNADGGPRWYRDSQPAGPTFGLSIAAG